MSRCHADATLPEQVAADYGFREVTTTDELDAALPHAAPFSVATISGANRAGSHFTDHVIPT